MSNSLGSQSANTSVSKAGPSKSRAITRNPFFRFLASLRLALLLLAVIIVADAAGTIYESEFSAEVARAYIYEAWWFNLWLLLLCVNLASVAISRRPWQRRHIGFLLTHFGIITLLIGAVVGRLGGIEGTTTLFKGNAPVSFLMTDQREVQITSKNSNDSESFRVKILPRSPSVGRPVKLGSLRDGTEVWAIDYAKKLDANFTPQAVPQGEPALKLRLSNPQMNQTIEQWVMLNSEGHQMLNVGPITIQLQRDQTPLDPSSKGTSGTSKTAMPQLLEERIFGFALYPEQQVNKVVRGGSTGSKVILRLEGDKPLIVIRRDKKEWTFPAQPGQTVPLGSEGFSVHIENYWPDFRLTSSGSSTLSDKPNNPAVLVTIRGMGKAGSVTPEVTGNPHGVTPDLMNAQHLGKITISDKQELRYLLKADENKLPVMGAVKINLPIQTGWGAWTLTVLEYLPAARDNTQFTPVAESNSSLADNSSVEGLKIKLIKGSQSHEEWVAMDSEVNYPISSSPEVAFSFRTVPIPFGLQLTQFDVSRQEGSDSPAGFKSTLLVTNTEGETFTGSCSMNTPMNYPDAFWRSITGFTYKISQASWNPDNLDQSSVQILFDPGWSLKWIGSLIICSGIFCLFYLQPPRKSRQLPIPSLTTKSEPTEIFSHV